MSSPAPLSRTYRPYRWWIVFVASIWMVILTFGLLALHSALISAPRQPGLPSLLVSLLTGSAAMAAIAWGGYGVVATLRLRIDLYADAIEFRGFGAPGKLRKSEIAGRRSVQKSERGAQIILIPKAAGQKKLVIYQARNFNVDSIFQDWIKAIPDLDLQDFNQSEHEIVSARDPRATPGDRLLSLKRARRTATLLSRIFVLPWSAAAIYPGLSYESIIALPQLLGSPAASAYVLLYPWLIAVVAAMPWIALAVIATNPGLYRFAARPNDAHAKLGVLVFLPGFVLGIRALDFHLLDWQPMLEYAALGGVLLAVVFARIEQTMTPRPMVVIALLLTMTGYCFGVLSETNALLDRAEPQLFTTRILDRQAKGLTLAPWGPHSRASFLTLPLKLYGARTAGDTACVTLHPGSIGFRWYSVSPSCPPTTH